MRSWFFVPMMTLCLLCAGCGAEKNTRSAAEAARQPYRDMESCSMEAVVTCGTGSADALAFTLRCACVPDGKSTVEVLAPETAAGVIAGVDGTDLTLTYGDVCLSAGAADGGGLSPALCLPCLMDALREGWLLEENREELNGVPCLRLAVDQTGEDGVKRVFTCWLREDGGTPVRGEIAADGEIILTAEFTDFQFGAILNGQNEAAAETQEPPAQ